MPNEGTPEDKQIPCIECAGVFAFTGGEQLYFRDRGLKEPRRCPKCRANKRQRIEQRSLERTGNE